MITRVRTINAHALFFLLSTTAGAAECLSVEGPSVRVSTLLPFVERAEDQPLDRVLTSTPDPGTRRWITAIELRQWGLTPRVGLEQPGFCLERQLKPLQAENVRSEIQAALHSGFGDVQLLGLTSIQPALSPEGRLSLPLGGLQLLSSAEGVCSFLWRGSIEYDTHRLAPIKVLGRYQAQTIRFAAKRDLLAGDVLSSSDYERTAEPGCPHGAVGPAPAEGSIMRRALKKGDGIEAAMLKAPTLVEAGSEILVKASAGGASVSMAAIAESAGRRGDSMFVRNKESGKRIRVLLTGKGEASALIAGTTK